MRKQIRSPNDQNTKQTYLTQEALQSRRARLGGKDAKDAKGYK